MPLAQLVAKLLLAVCGNSCHVFPSWAYRIRESEGIHKEFWGTVHI